MRLGVLVFGPPAQAAGGNGENRPGYEAAIRKAREADAMEEPPASVRDTWLECYEGEA